MTFNCGVGGVIALIVLVAAILGIALSWISLVVGLYIIGLAIARLT
ncbi:MAG: hypothetical protein Q7T33_03540 [Dehalococcoidia bacterium]|nr:hypothetical protein [Dehalococcoidia bacterium]